MTQQPLVLKRLISATCQEVFVAWSKPEIMKQWLFPLRSGWKATAVNDFRVGGYYQQDMIAEDGTLYSHTGIYKEIIPNQKIVFTWNSDSVKDTLVTIQLRAINNQTEITLTHDLLPNEEQYENHQGGWKECINHLEQFLLRESYHCTVTYQVSPEKVYQSLTKAEGLKNWWTQDCKISLAEIGSKSTFRFGSTYKAMEIKELIPNEKIDWKCVEHSYSDQNFTKSDEWVDTEIVFYLTKGLNGNTTELNFIHKGLTKELECFDLCQKGWNYFLKESLKAYLETGKGKPYC